MTTSPVFDSISVGVELTDGLRFGGSGLDFLPRCLGREKGDSFVRGGALIPVPVASAKGIEIIFAVLKSWYSDSMSRSRQSTRSRSSNDRFFLGSAVS